MRGVMIPETTTAGVAATGPSGGWLKFLSDSVASLPAAEKRVAALILAKPHDLLEMPLASVALASGVSEPTVIRCCRSFGCNGFADFKLRLARSLASGHLFVHADVDASDGAGELAAKVMGRAAAAIVQAKSQLDAVRLESAIALLNSARRVECYGLGASGLVAADAQHKLFRLGMPAVAYSDAHVHGMAATMLRPGDVVLAFSASGRSTDLLSSVDLALESGASVIGITALGSPLAARCTVALELLIDEDTDIYTPMTTRLVQLAVVDVLAVGVALRQGPELLSRLRRAKQALKDKRVRGFE